MLALYPFGRLELLAADRGAAPLIDLRILACRGQWPIQLTALLFGASVLGAQIPLSTFVRTDPAVTGYGLGADASTLSLLIGGYVLSLAAGTLAYPLLARRIGAPAAMMVGGAIASSVFAIALSATIDRRPARHRHGKSHPSIDGYLTVWAICGLTALLAAAVLARGRSPASARTK